MWRALDSILSYLGGGGECTKANSIISIKHKMYVPNGMPQGSSLAATMWEAACRPSPPRFFAKFRCFDIRKKYKKNIKKRLLRPLLKIPGSNPALIIYASSEMEFKPVAIVHFHCILQEKRGD